MNKRMKPYDRRVYLQAIADDSKEQASPTMTNHELTREDVHVQLTALAIQGGNEFSRRTAAGLDAAYSALLSERDALKVKVNILEPNNVFLAQQCDTLTKERDEYKRKYSVVEANNIRLAGTVKEVRDLRTERDALRTQALELARLAQDCIEVQNMLGNDYATVEKAIACGAWCDLAIAARRAAQRFREEWQ